MSAVKPWRDAGPGGACSAGAVFADSHAHLDFPDFGMELETVMQRAQEARVTWINTVATRLTDVPSLIRLCERFSQVFTTVGIHPHHAEQVEDASISAIVEAAGHHPKVVAVGETGLDFHYDSSARPVQERVFRHHIRAANRLNLPLVIHSREAEAVTRRIFEEEGGAVRGGVLHCFTGSLEMAAWGLAQGLYLSFSGVLTFKNGDALRQVARTVPLDRLLIETDAPYLAPVPKRGKRNEPAYVVRVAETLAALHGVSLERMAEATTTNYLRLFQPPLGGGGIARR